MGKRRGVLVGVLLLLVGAGLAGAEAAVGISRSAWVGGGGAPSGEGVSSLASIGQGIAGRSSASGYTLWSGILAPARAPQAEPPVASATPPATTEPRPETTPAAPARPTATHAPPQSHVLVPLILAAPAAETP